MCPKRATSSNKMGLVVSIRVRRRTITKLVGRVGIAAEEPGVGIAALETKEKLLAERLVQGDAAPDFTLPDAAGNEVRLGDFRGRNTIVYFYPAASTPGCTKQACDFRDSLAALKAVGYEVVGVSPDPVKDLAKFVKEEELTFPLLSDEGHKVAEAYGAWGEKKNYGRTYEGLIRSTIVVDPEGKVALAQYNVRATGHVAKLRRDLKLDK